MIRSNTDLARHLEMLRCSNCGQWHAMQRECCESCGRSDTLVPRQGSGRGVVHARTVVGRAPTDAFKAMQPYTIVLVKTEEGPLLMGHADASLLLGSRVEATLMHAGQLELLRFVSAEPVNEHLPRP